MAQKIELGDRIRDRITGFQGIAIGVTEWLAACRRWIIQPETLHEGKTIEAQSFDEPHIEIVDKHVVAPTKVIATTEAVPLRKTGGPERGGWRR